MAKKKINRWFLTTAIGAGAGVLFFALLLMVVPRYEYASGFATIADAVAYADSVPELPKPDNTNKVRPDYTTFYRSQRHGYLRSKLATVLSWVGLKKAPAWAPSYFKQLLGELLEQYKKHGVRKKVVYKVQPTTGTQFVVLGELSGAYHSLTRNLQKLKELSIIDENFKVIADDTYLVCMGDAISRSPYGMQTLTLLLRLKQANPDRMIYLRGNHEANKYWHAVGMKDQLNIFKCADQIGIIDELFAHLPLGLYAPILGHADHYVRFSHRGRAKSKKLKEDRFAHFLAAPQKGTLDRHQFTKAVTHNGTVTIDALLRSEKKRHSFQSNDGLRLLEADHGATTWTVLASPTRMMQEGFKFFHDAFAIIKVGAHKNQWAITLHAQDVRDKDGYKTRSYQFFTGKQMNLAAIAATHGQDPPVKIAAQPQKDTPLPDVAKPKHMRQLTFAERMKHPFLRPRKVVKRLVVPAQPQPQQPLVKEPSLRLKASAGKQKEVVTQINDRQTVSVTVSPPSPDSKDQSTVVSVKVTPATVKADKKKNESFSIASGMTVTTPTVTPVAEHAQRQTHGGNTAARLEMLAHVDE